MLFAYEDNSSRNKDLKKHHIYLFLLNAITIRKESVINFLSVLILCLLLHGGLTSADRWNMSLPVAAVKFMANGGSGLVAGVQLL